MSVSAYCVRFHTFCINTISVEVISAWFETYVCQCWQWRYYTVDGDLWRHWASLKETVKELHYFPIKICIRDDLGRGIYKHASCIVWAFISFDIVRQTFVMLFLPEAFLLQNAKTENYFYARRVGCMFSLEFTLHTHTHIYSFIYNI